MKCRTAGVIAFDPETKAKYYGVTGQVSIVQASVMQIDTDNGETQRGYSVGAGFHRMGVPVALGYERWKDNENTRIDYGLMYNYSDELMFTASRVEEDDLGFKYNYFGVVHTKGNVLSLVHISIKVRHKIIHTLVLQVQPMIVLKLQLSISSK